LPRRKKQQIKTNNRHSLEGLLQETYNDACSNINDAQKNINELTNSSEPEDVDDLTKIAKEKNNSLKVKDSAIRIKLEIAKLQTDIIKHSGDIQKTMDERNIGTVSLKDFKSIRKMIEDSSNDNDNDL
tara:strand:- start:1049 stop:1432 length:384 start_codon:yes stop_codon:yes gene_type:complete